MPLTPEEIEEATERIEEEKAEKQQLREEKKRIKEERLKKEKNEKLVAPLLLFITLVVSALVAFFFS